LITSLLQLDEKLISEKEYEELILMNEELAKMINGYISHLKQRKSDN